jgi:glyceraldehyde-3-phosphate dehydrogenase/erythrose-4-phosphate dehydrogenase
MKLTKSKLEQLIKEELFKEQQEGNVVVDMTGRSYNVEELAQYLDNEEIEVLLSRPEMYFVRVDRETGNPIGIGPE